MRALFIFSPTLMRDLSIRNCEGPGFLNLHVWGVLVFDLHLCEMYTAEWGFFFFFLFLYMCVCVRTLRVSFD